MAERRVELTYEGPALQDGEIEVRDLAPSLLAFAGLVEELQGMQYPHQPGLSVRIRETRRGSFGVEITLAHNTTTLVQVLAANEHLMLAAALGSIYSTIFLLVQQIKQRHGWPVRKTKLPDGRVEVEFRDGTIEVVAQAVADALTSRPVWTFLRDWFAPIQRPSVNRIRARTSEQPEIAVTDGDVDAFYEQPGEPVEVNEFEDEATLEVRALAFDPEEKWRVRLQGETVWVRMADPDFVARVQSGEEVFAEGDRLLARMRTTVYEGADGKLHHEHVVQHVLDHQHPYRDGNLWDGEAS